MTKDVAEGAIMVGIPARATLVDATTYQKSFVPYGTCDSFDPQTQKLEWLQCEVERLRKDLTDLREERDSAPDANRRTTA